jgi:hypothetical protein
LIEHVLKYLIPNTPVLANMFIAGCQDAKASVAVAAMNATSSYVSAIADEEQLMLLSGVIVPMLTVMNNTLAAKGDDDIVIKGLEVLQECIANDQPLVNDHIAVSYCH